MNSGGQKIIKRENECQPDGNHLFVDQKKPSNLQPKPPAPTSHPAFRMADLAVQKFSQGRLSLSVFSNCEELKKRISEASLSGEGRLSIKISSTEEAIKGAAGRLNEKTFIQGITDSLGGPGLEGQIKNIAKLNAAHQNLLKAKEHFSQGDLAQAARYERLAYNGAQEFHGDYSDYQRESLEHGEDLANLTKTTGDTLFALGVTGAVAAVALPGALAMASKGLGWTALSFGLFTSGEGSALGLAGSMKRGLFLLIGGEENAINDKLIFKDFKEGVNLGSFQFFAPFAGALGQAWAQNSPATVKFVKELLPISGLQSAHGAAQAVADGAGVQDAMLSAGLGFLLPYVFHGAEKALSPSKPNIPTAPKHEPKIQPELSHRNTEGSREKMAPKAKDNQILAVEGEVVTAKAKIGNNYHRLQEELTHEVASRLHDAWRAPRRKPDGAFEPRIKPTKDAEWIRKNGGKTEVDIANTEYKDLPSDWQGENKISAEVAVAEVLGAVKSGKSMDGDFIEKASSVIHDKWLERNGAWAAEEQKKPYRELSEAEKEKDRVIIRKAVEIYANRMKPVQVESYYDGVSIPLGETPESPGFLMLAPDGIPGGIIQKITTGDFFGKKITTVTGLNGVQYRFKEPLPFRVGDRVVRDWKPELPLPTPPREIKPVNYHGDDPNDRYGR